MLALTHTVTLGWITLAIMGASYQLIPIVLERPIWSERLARWQLGVLAVAVLGMIAHFYLGTWPGLAAAAGLLAVGIGLHLLNVGLSLRGFTRWTFTARMVVLGYGGLALTTLFGLALAANRVWPFLPGEFFPTLHAHVHLALLGWVTPMIFGVAARVYPMFLLAPAPGRWSCRLQLWGLAVGLAVGRAGARRRSRRCSCPERWPWPSRPGATPGGCSRAGAGAEAARARLGASLRLTATAFLAARRHARRVAGRRSPVRASRGAGLCRHRPRRLGLTDHRRA